MQENRKIKMGSYGEIFNINFKVLQLFGLWTIETDSLLKKKLYYLYQRFSLLMIMLFCIQAYIDLYFVRHEIEKFTFNFCFAVVGGLIYFKSLNLTQILPGASGLRENLNRNAEEENDEECKKILSKASYEIKILNVLVHSMGVMVMLMLYIAPLFHRSGIRNLPIRQWFPFDIQISPNYELAFLYQILFSFPIAMIELEIDLSLIGLTISLSAEYDILKKNVEKNFSEIYKEKAKGVKNLDQSTADAKTLEIIRNSVVRHQEITGQVFIT